MSLDWKALRPHVPVDPGADEYEPRPDGVSEEIVHWIRADRSPILVGGPAGVGKSTELAHAAELLREDRFACFIPLDRWENMRRLDPDRLLQRIANRVAQHAKETADFPRLNPELLEEAQNNVSARFSPATLARLVLAEVGRMSPRERVVVLLDGLEKVPEGQQALELFDALAVLAETGTIDLVTVVPWHAAFGPRAETIIRAGERFISARALEIKAKAFLRKTLLRRLNVPNTKVLARRLSEDLEGVRKVIDSAAEGSGGIPRTFLQLMADAASYARLRRDGEWPSIEDLVDAGNDSVDTFRRLLLPGDADAARAAAGTDGRELELDRKIRLMAHGILLERMRDDRTPVLEMHPLAEIAIERGDRRA